MEDGQTEPIPEYETMETEDSLVTTDKQAPRRVITDTGDIVEEPLMFKSDDQMMTSETLRRELFFHSIFLCCLAIKHLTHKNPDQQQLGHINICSV